MSLLFNMLPRLVITFLPRSKCLLILKVKLLLFRHFATPWTAACQVSLSFTISWRLLKLMSTESVMPPNHLVLYHPLLLLPSIFPSIRVFSNELALHIRWPKYGSLSFSISPSNEYSGLISLGLSGLISFLSKGFSRVFSNTIFQNYQFFGAELSYSSTLTSILE